MKTITTTLYGYDELSDAAKDVAYKIWLKSIENGDYDPTEFLLEEMVDSLHGLAIAVSGYKGRDWSVGMHNQNYKYILKKDPLEEMYCQGDEDLARDFYARTSRARVRRIGWWENNVLDGLRITRKQYIENEYHRYGEGYQVGKVKPCPFTGMCYDEDVLFWAQEMFYDGEELDRIFNILAKKLGELCEDEYDYQTKKEHFEEYHAYEDGECYLEDGSKYEH
jgi:hypothetical protein